LHGLLTNVNTSVVPSLKYLAVIDEGQTAIRSENRYVGALMAAGDAKDIELRAVLERKQAIWQRIDQAWDKYVSLPQVPEEARLWKLFGEEWARWKEADQKISLSIKEMASGELAVTSDSVRHQYLRSLNSTRDLFIQAEQSLGKLIQVNASIAQAAEIEAERSSTRAENMMLVVAGLAVVIFLVTGSLIVRCVLGTLGGEPDVAKGMVQRIAMGDLRPQGLVQAGDSESLMAYQDKMQRGLRSMVGDIVTSVSQTEAAAHELASASQQVASASEASADSASTMAAAIEQMSASIHLVASRTSDALSSTQRAGVMSSEGGQIIEAAITEINSIAHAVRSTASDINSLSESSARISSIVQVIKDVAEQTNLLALNAAIEAARAGESGRGFAVVADEVRKLAERTASATSEIAAMIDQIQSETRSSVKTTEEALSQVERGVALASEAGKAIHEIRGGIEQVVEVVADIGNAINEQRTASEEIAIRIEQVAQASEENGSAARQTADTARQLSALASQMRAATQGFTL
jgi:methyl-accepting chemotaxis protein